MALTCCIQQECGSDRKDSDGASPSAAESPFTAAQEN